MSVWGIAGGAAQQAAARAGVVLAETDTEFDPNTVSPGVMGFIMTGIFAAAVIALGFLLVTRLRRNAYRHEIRESIEQELAERDEPADGSAASGSAAPESTTGDTPDSEKPNQA